MSKLYVCKQYDTPYNERVCAIITTLEEHDKQIRKDTIDECIAKIDILEQISFGIVEVDLVKDLLEKLKEQSNK